MADQNQSPLPGRPASPFPPPNLPSRPTPASPSPSPSSDTLDVKFAPGAGMPPVPPAVPEDRMKPGLAGPGGPIFASNPPSPAPVAPAPAPVPSPTDQQAASYKTTIRTMADDIANLKAGRQPTGNDLEKTIASSPTEPRTFIPESAPKPVSAASVRPAFEPPQEPPLFKKPQAPVQPPEPVLPPDLPRPMAPAPSPKTASVPFTIPPATPARVPLAPASQPTPAQAAGRAGNEIQPIIIPESSSGSVRWKLYGSLFTGLVVIGGLVWFLATRNNEIATESPSPSPSESQTPAPVRRLALFFENIPAVSVSLSALNDFAEEFAQKFVQIAISPGERKLLTITSASKGGGELSFTDLMDRLLISYPLDLKATLGAEYANIAYGQREVFDTRGSASSAQANQPRMVFITESSAPAETARVMTMWETGLADQLESMFGFTKTKAASAGFLDNTHTGAAIRYKNFTYPDRTIDYALVSAGNGKTYLVIGNSREAIYTAIDSLQ